MIKEMNFKEIQEIFLTKNFTELVIVCIGCSKFAFDSIGPRVGTKLLNNIKKMMFIF